MTLVYPEGNVRSFAYNQDISRFVDAWLQSKIGWSAVATSAYIEAIMANKQTGTGDRLSWMVYKTGNPTDPSFTIGNATSDAITATEQDAFLRLDTDWKNFGRKLRLSGIRMAQASGKEDKMGYVDHQLKATVRQLVEGIGRLSFVGNPSTTNYAQLTGLDNIISYTGTYGGQTRSLSRGLVGNVFDATGATASVTDTGWDVTNGSVQIDNVGHGLTAVAGDWIHITDATGYVRTYTITAVNINDIQITPAYEGITDTALDIRIESPYADTSYYGAAGELTLEKLTRAFEVTTDGGDVANLGVCHSAMWGRIQSLVESTERSVSVSDLSRLGVSAKWDSFKLKSANLVVDNNAPRTKFYLLNTDYLGFKALKGFDKLQLAKSGLKDEASATAQYASMLGEIVLVGDQICEAVNRQAVITNLVV